MKRDIVSGKKNRSPRGRNLFFYSLAWRTYHHPTCTCNRYYSLARTHVRMHACMNTSTRGSVEPISARGENFSEGIALTALLLSPFLSLFFFTWQLSNRQGQSGDA